VRAAAGFWMRWGGGSCRIALARWNPEGRYELSRLETVAVADAGGFALNGKKAVVLPATAADWLIVSARTAGAANDAWNLAISGRRARRGITIAGFPPSTTARRRSRIRWTSIGSDALLGGLHTASRRWNGPVDRGCPPHIARRPSERWRNCSN